METIDQITQRQWDFIIVGTGMGGATLGFALAKAGHSVLFLEKGQSHINGKSALAGDYAETFFTRPEAPQPKHQSILAQAARCAEELEDVSGAKPRTFVPFIGSGTGGSTALYGMALERFFEADFTPRRYYPDAHDSSIPEAWPVDYNELKPYYETAEQLFRVRGTANALRARDKFKYLPPPPLAPENQALHDFLQRQGLHPYRLPMACEHVRDCRGCQGYLCGRDCKNDSGRICLEPALDKFGARLLDECEVLRLEASRSKVTGVVCTHQGEELTLRARSYVLAAGALETPRLLLSSVSPIWPNGLANDHGLVGKNLMRHYVDLYALFPGKRVTSTGNVKEVAFSDLYLREGRKLGSVQSFGFLPPAAMLVEEIEQDLRAGAGPWAAAAFRLVKPIPRFALKRLFSRALVLATTLEDLPYEQNCVMLSNQTDDRGRKELQINYTIRNNERTRIDAFREEMKKILKPYRYMLLKQADSNQRIAHVCGTCRFGVDPLISVCDANNKAHALANLYVSDSSVFPSSAGINPALTIAALSLRLADHIGSTQNE